MDEHKPEHKRKRRTREHVIADLSANYVERFVLRCGHTVERFIHDYGTDLMLITYDEHGEFEPGQIFMQLKATDALRVLKDQETIAFRVRRADVERWLREPMPYILVVYDAQADVAYWMYVQAYFEKEPALATNPPGKTITVYLQKANVMNEDAVRRFARYRDDVLRQRKGAVSHHA